MLGAFIVSALLGTGLHLAAFTIPGIEFLISTSVLGIGLLLAFQKSLPLSLSLGLFILAGLLHGYAYGESIVGTGMPPLFAYLLGFSLVQLALALAVWGLVQKAFPGQGAGGELRKKGFSSIGWLVCGAGLALLFPQVIGLLLTKRYS
ncbi:HupE/UreJ family protein [Synechocystis sp. LKSZ1]|uniref:HupE/UreJ family protein n=1 Tax=Synechocystis sp. LKSZ1 TaxID=3144951 RepID=UPI00336C187F